MDYTDIRFTVADGVATITLDRPAERNAFSGAMGLALGEAYTECDRDDAVRAVVLTGAGAASPATRRSPSASRAAYCPPPKCSARPWTSRATSRPTPREEER